MCKIWNGSDENCWRYRADTILSTDGRTDGRTMWNQYIPFNFVEAGSIMTCPTLCNGCNYITTVGLKLIHVSKRASGGSNTNVNCIEWDTSLKYHRNIYWLRSFALSTLPCGMPCRRSTRPSAAPCSECHWGTPADRQGWDSPPGAEKEVETVVQSIVEQSWCFGVSRVCSAIYKYGWANMGNSKAIYTKWITKTIKPNVCTQWWRFKRIALKTLKYMIMSWFGNVLLISCSLWR